MLASSKTFLLFSWNVRGLGDPEKCTIVRDAIRSASPTIVCLQETKLSDCNFFKAATFLPPNLSSSFVSSNAAGSRGGILTAWDPNSLVLDSRSIPNNYCLSTTFSSAFSEHTFSITNVYAPSDHRDSPLFLASLSALAPSFPGPWLLAGNFNLVRSQLDKDTAVSNSSLIAAFNDKINEVALLELPLTGCRFTWTSKRDDPTLARLDRVFHNVPFGSLFPSSSLRGLPRPTSDHTPLLATLSTEIPKPNNFRFENAWLLNSTFLPTVLPAWT
jgi:hypothetical protein